MCSQPGHVPSLHESNSQEHVQKHQLITATYTVPLTYHKEYRSASAAQQRIHHVRRTSSVLGSWVGALVPQWV